MFNKFLLTLGSLTIMTSPALAANAADTMKLELSSGGTVTIDMLPDRAPNHVERIKKLTNEGFYNGVVFHRVIDGFMAQTGDPTGTGTGGSKESDIAAEFTDYEYKRGTVGMARTANPNSANSQFFICFNDTGCSFLKGQYTVWGQVTEGMEFVDQLAKGEPPANPDKVVKATVGGAAAPVAAATTEEAPAEIKATEKAGEEAAKDAKKADAKAEKTADETAAETTPEAGTEPAAGGDKADALAVPEKIN